MGKKDFRRRSYGTVFLGIPVLAGRTYRDKCGLSMCVLGRSGHSQGPGTGNVAARTELIHPNPDPNGPSRALCSQLISHNSIKAHIYVEKMQPSLLEGNLTH